MIVGRPDNKIGNASYPVGKGFTGEAIIVTNKLFMYFYKMLLGTNQ